MDSERETRQERERETERERGGGGREGGREGEGERERKRQERQSDSETETETETETERQRDSDSEAPTRRSRCCSSPVEGGGDRWGSYPLGDVSIDTGFFSSVTGVLFVCHRGSSRRHGLLSVDTGFFSSGPLAGSYSAGRAPEQSPPSPRSRGENTTPARWRAAAACGAGGTT